MGAGLLGFMGYIAVGDGLTVPYIPMRVRGAMSTGVGQQDIMIHRVSVERENNISMSLPLWTNYPSLLLFYNENTF